MRLTIHARCTVVHVQERKNNSAPPYKISIKWVETLSTKLPAANLDNESDGEPEELEKTREAEPVGDVDAATREITSTGKKMRQGNGK